MDITQKRSVEPRIFGLASSFALVLCTSISFAETTGSPASEPSLRVQQISAEDFGALPFMQNPILSPSGARVAARAHTEKGLRLVIIELGSANKFSAAIPVPEKRDLLWYAWAGENRLLISVGKSQKMVGEDMYVRRLMMVDLATDQAHFIGKNSEGEEGDDVLYIAKDGSSLLLSIQETVYEYPSVWQVDLNTVRMKKVVKPRENVWEWFADTSGTVRVGLGRSGKREWVFYRKDADSDFEKVISRNVSEERDGVIDAFSLVSGSDQGYAVTNSKTGRFGLYRYDFATDTIGETVFEHPQVDVHFASFSDEGILRAVHYVDDRSRIEWFDSEMKVIQSEIDKALPNRLNRVISQTQDRERMIVWTGSASDPGRLYMYEPEAGVMRLLAKPYARIDAKALAEVQSTMYRARDGLEIPAYLTLPREREAKGLPLVVMPHGGPFLRDQWSYDTWVQFLANRGYAVLQPNYRGSTGYGKAFVEKGEGQWGRGMQDDIDDGVKWLVEQGTVDPKRVCIMGASFGGYAAMWASVRNPDIYRCAISFAGISDVGSMLRYDRKSFSATRYYRNWREKVQGEKDFDLTTVSPLHSVSRVTMPILIAHGGRDENVPPSQSKKFHDALTKAQKPHEFVLYEAEGHGFEDPVNAIDFLKRVEAFLEKHNPADERVANTR
jgi:dipeptidyl aminopeptidase/acylaminoacyl peptidase